MKPRVFVGSSLDSIRVARAIESHLKRVATVKVWDEGVFGLSNFLLDSLLKALEVSDFGVFVFAPDDKVEIKNRGLFFSVRDNVLFESGLFTGRLGRQRVFMIAPNSTKTRDNLEQLRIASDLNGIGFGVYDGSRGATKRQLYESLESACAEIRQRIKELGCKSETIPIHFVGSATTLDTKLTELIEREKLDGEVPELCSHVLQFAQKTLTDLWPGHNIVVSLKVVDPSHQLDRHGNPTHFLCYYPDGVEHHPEVFETTNGHPRVPIKGTAVGEAFSKGKPVYIADVNESAQRFDPDLFDRIKDHIRCIVAIPLFFSNEPVAVLKVDTKTPGLLKREDAVFSTFMRMVRNKFELTIRVAKLFERSRPRPRKPTRR